MLPIIGIVGAADDLASSVRHSYVRAIEEAGGVAVILPYTERADRIRLYPSLANGFMFIGGGDIDPHRYGESNPDGCEITPRRDGFELSLFPALFKTGKPIIGICRGLQVINVALGGTLIRNIPDATDGSVIHLSPAGEARHRIFFDTPTPRLYTNSSHHQAVCRLGEGLVAICHAEDGIVEAVRHERHPYLYAYQWHPEREKKCPPCGIKPILDFIFACRGQMTKGY